MNVIPLVTAIVILIGAGILASAIPVARALAQESGTESSATWRLLMVLITFFFVCYLVVAWTILSTVALSLELLVAGVFIGLAAFVAFVLNLVRRTLDLTRTLESERLSFLESTSDLVIAFDIEGVVLSSNPAWRRCLQIEETSGSPKSFFTYVPENERPKIQEAMTTVFHGEAVRLETMLRDSHGQEVPVEGTFVLCLSRGKSATIQAMFRDMSERVRAELALRESNAHLEQQVNERTRELQDVFRFNQEVLDGLDEPICVVDVETMRLTGANRTFLEQTGRTRSELLGMTCHEVTHGTGDPCNTGDDPCPIKEMLITGQATAQDHRHPLYQGDAVHVEVRTSPIRDERGQIVRAVHVTRDISHRKRAEEELKRLAYHDPLTGLPNRAFCKELLARAAAYANRAGLELAVLFVDLDRFKWVNDTLGHEVGDTLLREAAARLTSSVRRCDWVVRSDAGASTPQEGSADPVRVPDTVSRLGGDEFIILLSQIRNSSDAARVAARILERLQRPFNLAEREITISASIGISLYPTDTTEPEVLLKQADMAMYHAKELGKGQYQFFTSAMNAAALARFELESELRQAVAQGQFLLHYQPRVNLNTGDLTGLEALVRWQHPRRGLLSPGEFFAVAEECGLTAPLFDFCLNNVCAQLRAWEQLGWRSVPVSINVSARQFLNDTLASTLNQVLERYRTRAELISLEVTETSLAKDPSRASALLHQLRALGIETTIDNFGTGQSALAPLWRLPVVGLKIDRSFIAEMTDSPHSDAVVGAIVTMAHGLKLQVIAEGVETSAQRDRLRALGCDEAQGYLFARPAPSDEVAAGHFRAAGPEN